MMIQNVSSAEKHLNWIKSFRTSYQVASIAYAIYA